MGSADPPLAVHYFYGHRHRQLHRPGTGEWDASALGDLLAAAPARLAPVQRSVLVRAAVCHQVVQWATLGFGFLRRFRLARTVEGDRLANELLEGGLVNIFSFVDVDRGARVSVEGGVDETG